MWPLAIATAIVATAAAAWAGLLLPEETGYLRRAWNSLASIIGGLVFGYGMALAGNCGYGALARLGGGDVRALVIVMVIGVSAHAVMSGPLAPLRLALFPVAELPPGQLPPGIAHGLAALTGAAPVWPALAVAMLLAALALRDGALRRDRAAIGWSVAVGLAIASGFAATGWIARTGFDAIRVESHSFTAPQGDAVLYLMTGSGGGIDFGIGSVAGVVLGAFLGATLRRQFRWEACDDARELARQVAGAALMGFGGVVAFGCSVGQGLSAFAVLAHSAPVTLTAIAAGAALGLRQLIGGLSPGAGGRF